MAENNIKALRRPTEAEHDKIFIYFSAQCIRSAWQLRQIMPIAAFLAVVTGFFSVLRHDGPLAILSVFLATFATYAYLRVNAAGNKIKRYMHQEYMVCRGTVRREPGSEPEDFHFITEAGETVDIDVVAPDTPLDDGSASILIVDPVVQKHGRPTHVLFWNNRLQ